MQTVHFVFYGHVFPLHLSYNQDVHVNSRFNDPDVDDIIPLSFL